LYFDFENDRALALVHCFMNGDPKMNSCTGTLLYEIQIQKWTAPCRRSEPC
jgi:hypothetical protein